MDCDILLFKKSGDTLAERILVLWILLQLLELTSLSFKRLRLVDH